MTVMVGRAGIWSRMLLAIRRLAFVASSLVWQAGYRLTIIGTRLSRLAALTVICPTTIPARATSSSNSSASGSPRTLMMRLWSAFTWKFDRSSAAPSGGWTAIPCGTAKTRRRGGLPMDPKAQIQLALEREAAAEQELG